MYLSVVACTSYIPNSVFFSHIYLISVFSFFQFMHRAAWVKQNKWLNEWIFCWYLKMGWWRGTAVERRSLAGKLSLSHARPSADGWPLMWVNRPLEVSQLGQLSLSSSWGRWISSELQLDVRHLNRWWHHLVNAYEVKTQAWWKVMATYRRGMT